MRHTNLALALLTAAVLTACGGNGSSAGDQTLKTKYSAQVTFGDSLSDVGTYAVGAVVQLGGGKYTINGNNTTKEPTLTGKNWTELVATQLSLPAPCAAQTGLQGDATKGFSVAVANHAGCTNYAQGGARVTNPVGPGNKLTGSPLGQMTVPVAQQVANHLAASSGKFSGNEIVTVMAGGNDVLMQLGTLAAGATAAGTAAGLKAGQTAFATSLTIQLAAGATNPASAAQAIGLALQTEAANPNHTDQSVVTAAVTAAAQQPGNSAVASPAVYGPMVAKAQAEGAAAGATAGAKAGADYFAANAPAVVTAMGTAGAELAALVKTQIIGNGANYVVVNNLPDVANTPSGKAQSADVQALIKTMVDTFNGQLKSGLAGDPKVLLVDLYSVSHDQAANPAPYGLTNVSTPACGPNALGTTSLACNSSNVIAGDVSHYMFADDIHPTPFEYSLVARYVLEQMILKGWL
jgi:phospholipase/lecithinase/hemolysin